MNTAKVYRDSHDEPCTIHQMVQREPMWAAVRIQKGEAATAELTRLRAEHDALVERLRGLEQHEFSVATVVALPTESCITKRTKAEKWIRAADLERELK